MSIYVIRYGDLLKDELMVPNRSGTPGGDE